MFIVKRPDPFLDPASRWYYPSRWLILVLLGLAIYGQTFGYGFVFDDNYLILNTPYIKGFDRIGQLWAILPKTRLIGVYSFALNYWVGQLHPQGYHIFNFLVHLLATGLVWAFSTVLFKAAGMEPQELPFFIALLFMAHPCQTQAVTYVSQRFESMATVFYLESVFAYLCGRIASSVVHKAILFAISVGSAILGIFTKEVAATIPLMILAIEFILLNRKPAGPKKLPSWPVYLPIAFLGLIFAFLFVKIVRTDPFTVYFHFSRPSESHDGDIVTGGKYILTQMRVFLTFLRLLILPINQNLDYDYPLSTGLLSPPLTLAGLGMIGLMALLVFKLRERWPLISFGLAWILITFSINTAPRANPIFEHKLYLISFGFLLAAVCALAVIIKDRKLLGGILIAIIAAASILSYERNHVWKDELALWSDVAQNSPHKARPYEGLGVYYGTQGDLIQALYDFNRAIELDPVYAEAYGNRGNTYFGLGKYLQAAADLNKAIALNPAYAEAYTNRGNLYVEQGHFAQAMLDYNKAISLNIYYANAYYDRGILFTKQGDFIQALSDFNTAIAIDPNFRPAYVDREDITPDSFYNRGLVLAKQGDFAQAMSDFNNAIKIYPDYAKAYINRGSIYSQQGDYNRALSDFNKVIQIEPGVAEAYIDRGTLYAQHGSTSLALLDYNKAIDLNPYFQEAFFDRAVIYFQLNEYDNAWADVEKAQGLGASINPGFIRALQKASGRT